MGSALLVLPSVAGWGVFALVVASIARYEAAVGSPVGEIVFHIVATASRGLVTWGLVLLARLASQRQATRADLARSAVATERLRFARDLHDLLGLSLSGIMLRGELAHRLVVRDPARAGAELAQILQICWRALADVRSVASGYRELPLEEARSVEAVLTAPRGCPSR